MNMKIKCFGVRYYEINLFKQIEIQFNLHLDLSETYISDETIQEAVGYDVIIIRANCYLSFKSLSYLHENGLRFILTRTIGYNHIDLEACRYLNIKVAYAPGYSPASIAELGISLVLNIMRNIPEAISNSSRYNFELSPRMFGMTISGSTVGIVGCGRIGIESAKIYNSLGANVIGTDIIKNSEFKKYGRFVSPDELYAKSNIVSLHAAYFPEKNYHMIDRNAILRMRKNVIIVNTARGELIDTKALVEGIEGRHILGAGLDVVEDENIFFFKRIDKKSVPDVYQKLIDLYPRVIITPHISSSTERAVRESIVISIHNLFEFLATGKCKNQLC